MRFGGIAAVLFVMAAPAWGRELYLSTTGSDAFDGTTSATAWRTFPFAVSQLQPGDVLNVENGLWTSDDGGVLFARCSGFAPTAKTGRADAGIRVRAVNERKAHIKSDGSSPAAEIRSCSYWTLDGLLLENGDKYITGQSVTSTALVADAPQTTLKHLLVWKNNRYENAGSILILFSDRTLVEECEMYDYHRYGLLVWESSNVTVRRCYANSRRRPSLDGGFKPSLLDRADYDYGDNGTNTLFENCIGEGSFVGFHSFPYGGSINGRFLGVMSLENQLGAAFYGPRDGGPGGQGAHMQEFLAVRSQEAGARWSDMNDSRCDRCSILDARRDGFVAGSSAGSLQTPRSYLSQTLVTGTRSGTGLKMMDQTDWSASDVNVYGFTALFEPAGHANFINSHTENPMLDSCLVMLPQGSPMKGKASDGGDVGANVLYRYQDGVLTDTPLWGPSFPCGAQVAGVNDKPDASCFDVHQRLGVDTCMFPPHYIVEDAGVAPDGAAGAEPQWFHFGASGCSGTAGVPTLLALLAYAHSASRRRRTRRK